MDAFTLGCQERGDRVLGQPVDLQARMQPAQLIGDGLVPAGMAQPDGGGDVQSPLRAAAAAVPALAALAAGPGSSASTNSRMSRLTLTGSRACGEWPDPASSTSRARPPRASASLGPASGPTMASSVPWMTRHGHWIPREQRRHAVTFASRMAARLCVYERLGRGLKPPGDAVLDGLGRVRFGEYLGEEEFQEAAVVPLPVAGVVLGPALVAVERLLESPGIGQPRRGERRQRRRRADEDLAGDALRAGRRPDAARRTRRVTARRPRRGRCRWRP